MYGKPILFPVPVPVPFKFGHDTHGHVYVTCGRTVITTAGNERFTLVSKLGQMSPKVQAKRGCVTDLVNGLFSMFFI